MRGGTGVGEERGAAGALEERREGEDSKLEAEEAIEAEGEGGAKRGEERKEQSKAEEQESRTETAGKSSGSHPIGWKSTLEQGKTEGAS